MPELPEVETVARDLERLVAGATISDVEVRWDRTIRHPLPPERFAAELRGATIRRVGRRAKSVLVHLVDGRVMTVALRMTGALIVAAPGTPDDRYARVVFRLADGRELRYRDVRKFGRIGLWEPGGVPRAKSGGKPRRRVGERAEPYRVGDVFARHGPEPLARSFSAARFAARLNRRSARLKTLLLDQSFIAGVGNIYADEALWRARLHYDRPTETMRRGQVAAVLAAARAVMTEALEVGGTSFDDLYVNVNGESGYFERSLDAYGRAGLPCRRCGTLIVREPFMNRSSYRCPHCQPRPRRAKPTRRDVATRARGGHS
jgi:formamidopyrimidine-DNA glycosylase